ncbi:hypothetical protein L1857_10055 [Amycolatopsis thermalba]|uniref:Uncharacterized protein n=1 Tax=Amycolatopsis thermalba TaxID=944492 RepID=A0ABY4NST3_9PSEU|nr:MULTISPECIES: hypothetical protein [Amycolatopsis]UQS23134.1 hypothetical protein L1857_10055 [Amycolatopsis thermalba]
MIDIHDVLDGVGLIESHVAIDRVSLDDRSSNRSFDQVPAFWARSLVRRKKPA